jgi:hypothetical protein
MDHTVTALERAFALAKSGKYTTVPEIRKRLVQEGYSVAQITGVALSKQLRALIRAARVAP